MTGSFNHGCNRGVTGCNRGVTGCIRGLIGVDTTARES